MPIRLKHQMKTIKKGAEDLSTRESVQVLPAASTTSFLKLGVAIFRFLNGLTLLTAQLLNDKDQHEHKI
jgi:hypothetical protein